MRDLNSSSFTLKKRKYRLKSALTDSKESFEEIIRVLSSLFPMWESCVVTKYINELRGTDIATHQRPLGLRHLAMASSSASLPLLFSFISSHLFLPFCPLLPQRSCRGLSCRSPMTPPSLEKLPLPPSKKLPHCMTTVASLSSFSSISVSDDASSCRTPFQFLTAAVLSPKEGIG